MDTVLIGGIGFLILVGLCFLTIKKIGNSSINDRNKRVLNYLVFKWHSNTYLIPG